MPLAEAQGLWPVPKVAGTLRVPPLARQADSLPSPARTTGQTPPTGEPHGPHFEPYQPALDERVLREFAVWCQRFSPAVGLEEAEFPECLLLDVHGSAHLFGGEQALADQLVQELRAQRLLACMAIADTVGAAWAVAHYPRWATIKPTPLAMGQVSSDRPRSAILVIPPGRHESILASLPIEALRLPEQAVQILHELAIQRIDQLLALPRASLPSRLGPSVLLRLDQACGRAPEWFHCEQPLPLTVAEWSFEIPVADRSTIETVLRRLVTQVVDQLAPRQHGVQRLQIRLVDVNREEVCFSIGCVRPSSSVPRLMELVLVRLEQLRIQAEVSSLEVRATLTVRLESRQQSLFSDTDRDFPELALLMDRLSARLGEDAVLRPRLDPDAQPEAAVRWEPAVGESHETGTGSGSQKKHKSTTSGKGKNGRRNAAPTGSPRAEPEFFAARPLYLKPKPLPLEIVRTPLAAGVDQGPPVQFLWEGRVQRVVRSWGPERIQTGWWRQGFIERDYYRVETESGQRFWLFQNLRHRTWFLHGLFD